MMKFLYNDRRTWELVRGWRSNIRPVPAAFFFHHRGDATQKSFEGLIRSILSQLLENEQDIFTPLLPMFQDRYRDLLRKHDLGSLRIDLVRLIEASGLEFDSRVHAAIEAIWECQFPRRKLREIIKQPMLSVPNADYVWRPVERSVLARKELILNPPKQGEPGAPTPTAEQQLRAIKPPIYRTEWDDVTTDRFLSRVIEWRNAMNLRDKLVSLVALANPDPQSDMRKRSAPMIEGIVQRQRRREFYQPYVESEKWTKSRLSQALKLVLEQKEVDLDLFLFLDALDEYDGPTEFITDFLKELVKERPDSQTRIRILFSSRPWNGFIDEFGECPGFEIHNHTQDDIRQLCAQIIQPDIPGSKDIIRLIGGIVGRARGVFLWVKLVMHDLCRHAADCIATHLDPQDLRKELLRTLKAIPDDLADYYGTIIQRISPSSRWETYCLLESVCRSYEPAFLYEVPAILACSTLSDYGQVQETSYFLGNVSKKEAEDRLRDVSGGLVEVVETRVAQTTAHQLQLLHQTMLEFVEQPQFKRIVLGQQAHITVENGHTFLTKYLLCRQECQISPTILRHAYQSEKTTGVGLYDLLRGGSFTMPGYLLERDLPSNASSRLKVSPIGVAVSGMLHLSIKEALEQDGAAIANSSESFLSLVMWSFDKSVCSIHEAVGMIEFLKAHGCNLDQDVSGLSKMITRDRNDSSFERQFNCDESDQMIKAALSGCTNLEMELSCFPFNDFSGKALHFSSPAIAKYLLGRGADPNSVTPHGETPLDIIIKGVRSSQYLTLEERHTLCLLLVRAGGSTHSCSSTNWESLFAKFGQAGLETLPFPERQLSRRFEPGKVPDL